MKKLLLPFALVTTLTLAACSDDKPPTRVVHETRVIHHRSSETVNVPARGADDFEPVERPATYSR